MGKALEKQLAAGRSPPQNNDRMRKLTKMELDSCHMQQEARRGLFRFPSRTQRGGKSPAEEYVWWGCETKGEWSTILVAKGLTSRNRRSSGRASTETA